MLLFLAVGIQSYAYSQEKKTTNLLKTDSVKHHVDSVKFQAKANNISKQYDVANLVKDILHPHKAPDSVFKKPSGITIIPNIASNPSIGFQLGIKAVAGRKLGTDPNTLLSVAATSVSYTTKGILYFYVNHNIYAPGNKWNFQGSIVVAKSVTPDYGLGIGMPDPNGSAEDQALVNANRKPRAYHSIYFNLREKVYKEVEKNLFVGAGVSFDIRTKIVDKADTTNQLTPYNIYSDEHGFKRDGYRADGLLFNIQYTTRDNQNRAYKGIYADAGFRVNQTWMGSTKSAVQFTTDFRKYFSLSSENPGHVIAIWNWGSYLLSGDIPYLELPGTAKDGSFRSGRGYTTGYFKGTKYNYSEIEYRFPILSNKFISGVAFFNEQTANDETGTKLFQKFQPGGGGGLRVLFNKATRTNLCLDYAWGKYGSKGFFLGLNEAF
nr:BamA/TamA family outer membrane protein [Mucilaginibacter sp. FT3.2]